MISPLLERFPLLVDVFPLVIRPRHLRPDSVLHDAVDDLLRHAQAAQIRRDRVADVVEVPVDDPGGDCDALDGPIRVAEGLPFKDRANGFTNGGRTVALPFVICYSLSRDNA